MSNEKRNKFRRCRHATCATQST